MSIAAWDSGSVCFFIRRFLDDISLRVRLQASVEIGRFGSLAKSAVPKIVARYRADRGNWTESLKISAIGALGAINGDSEEGIRLLIEVTRGANSGKLRLKSKEFTSEERLAAVIAIGRIGPPAEKAVPVLLDLLRFSALRLDRSKAVFLACTEALGNIGILDRDVERTLKKIREGKGVEPRSRSVMARARVAADTALRRLKQSGRSNKVILGQPKATRRHVGR